MTGRYEYKYSRFSDNTVSRVATGRSLLRQKKENLRKELLNMKGTEYVERVL